MPTTPALPLGGAAASSGPAAAIADRFAGAPVSSAHGRWVAASPADVRRAIDELTTDELLVARLLMGVRALPFRLVGAVTGRARTVPRSAERARSASSRTFLQQFARLGFMWLYEGDDGLAAATVAQFWRPRPRWAAGVTDADSFYAFAEPGWAKAVTTLTVSPERDGTRLATTTAVVTTDAAARRAFRRYWLLIGAPSGLIRREWLSAIARRAERQGPRPERHP